MLALAGELDNAPPGAVDAEARDECVALKEAGRLLNLAYDAMRMRASRNRAIVKVGGAAYVWRSWIQQQPRSEVRSVAEHEDDVA